MSRKGTNGVSTNGVTANFMFFDRGTFWVPVCQNRSIVHNFFPNLSKFVTFAATPLVSTPLFRDQGVRADHGEAPQVGPRARLPGCPKVSLVKIKKNSFRTRRNEMSMYNMRNS